MTSSIPPSDTLFFIYGPPGSGKSTIARQFSQMNKEGWQYDRPLETEKHLFKRVIEGPSRAP